jgi:EmrB/QacA subfamily drug resistance transporter
VIFTLNVPVGLIGLFLGFTLLRESKRVTGLKFDLPGFLLSAAGFSAMLLGLSDVGTDGWTSPGVLTKFAIGVVALSLWVWVELTSDHPLLDLRLFKIPIFALSAMVSFVLTVGMFGGMLLLPLFLQNLRGLGAAETGIILIFQVLPMTILMPVVGRLVDKVGARAMIPTGLPLLALTTWQMGALDMTTSDTTIKLWLLARGASMGIVMMPSMTAGLNAVSLPQMSRASSITNVMRQLFGSLGTAMVVTILQSRQTFHTAILSQTVTPENIPLQQLMASAQQWGVTQGMNDVQSQAMGVMMAARQVATSAAVMGFDDVFRVTAIVTLLAIGPALFMKTRRVTGRGPTIMAD